MNLEKRFSPGSFAQMIWNDGEYKSYFLLSCGCILLQLTIFKVLYPFPNFLPDSYSYIDAATSNDDVNTWPIGYSKFLRLLSVLTSSHLALVVIQYLFLTLSVMYLLYTVFFVFRPGKWACRILLVLNICNPLLLYVSNFVSSDALFASLSLIWFAQLVQVLFYPTRKLTIAHALICFAVFAVRYNAIYYPLVSLIVVGCTKDKRMNKMIFTGTITILIAIFLLSTLDTYKNRIGKPQFSPFAGWQLASNALYGYSHVVPELRKTPPVQFKYLHSVVNKDMDSLSRLRVRPDDELGIYYLWNESSPLNQYMHLQKLKDTARILGKGWGDLGPLYSKYGWYLIREYPAVYLRYYILPNLINFYVPDPEFLSVQNMGFPTIDNKAVIWFKLRSNRIRGFFSDSHIEVTAAFPYLFAMLNVFFVLSIAGFLLCGGFSSRNKTQFQHFVRLSLVVWLCNVGFSVLASPIVLRYQLFPMITTGLFTVLLLSTLVKEHNVETIKPILVER